MPNLFDPTIINGMELQNRFVRSATWDATADDDGFVTDTSVELYKTLGRGNIGLVVSGYAFVSLIGKAAVRQYGIHSDDMIPGLRRIVEAVHQGGSRIALQIVHAGSQVTFLNPKPDIEVLAVSKRSDISAIHREMTEEDIQKVISEFGEAALRGKEAGFDAVQLNGVHGYLFSQMHSPLLNKRTDRWGGTAENRRRFHLEVIREIRKLVGDDFPVMIKYGIRDYSEEGLTLKEGLETARLLVEAGIDAIEISFNTMKNVAITPKQGEPERAYFRDWTAAAKKAVDIPIILVHGVRSIELARDVLERGDADLIAMCRPFVREPNLVQRWAKGDTSPAKCILCNKCLGITLRGEPIECADERVKQ